MAHTSGTPKSRNKGAHEGIYDCVRCMRNTSREAFGTFEGMKSDGKRGSGLQLPPALSPETKLQINLLKARLWMEALMMRRLEFSDPMLLWSDVDRPSYKSNHLDMPSIEVGVMRA